MDTSDARARLGAACLVALSAWLATATPAFAQAASGRALYEARCVECHDASVHNRSARSATTYAQIRAAVARWDHALGSAWHDPEIDAVTRYLNDTYYHLPCPSAVCSARRASNDARRAPR